MKEFAKKAVEIMNFKKVSFGDVRVIEERIQNINMKNTELTEMRDDITLGFGVRVLYNGGWGFASSNIMKISEVENVVIEQ
jgi:TldD protein